MKISVVRTGVFAVNTMIVPCGDNKVFVVDPATCSISGDETKIVDYLKSRKLECIGIILTHSHFDHITGIATLKQSFPEAIIAIHENEKDELINPPGPMNDSIIRFFGDLRLLEQVSKQPAADILLKNDDTLDILLQKENNKISENVKTELAKWKVVHTPGHTSGSICLHNMDNKLFISGDTLFDYGGYGRTDMYGGDEREIRKSLSFLFHYIPEGTLVYPGHDSFGFVYNR